MKHSRGVEFQTETDDEVIEFAHFRGDEPSGGEPYKNSFHPHTQGVTPASFAFTAT